MHLEDPLVRNSEDAADSEPAPDPDLSSAETAAGGTGSSRSATALRLGIGLSLVLAVWLRFWTPSALWLDEALTVDIARAPLHAIAGLLRDDGAPPLFYYLLHFWMLAFGQSDLATRSLSGIVGVINLPLAWLTGYRVGSRWWSLESAPERERLERMTRGRITAWALLLLVASSPFVVYYDTEARMYGLVILLGTLLVLCYTALLRRPTVLRALGLAVVTSALLYSHYWALYSIAVIGVITLWCAVKGPFQKAFRYALGALVVAGLSFIPWLPTFWFQLNHTGTPWATPVGLTVVVFAVTQFAGGNSDPGRALAVIFFFFGVLAVLGVPLDRWRVVLDLRSRPGVRLIAAGVFASLVIGVLAGEATGSTFADRYTATLAVPTLLVMAYGLTALSDARTRNALLSLAVVFGLLGAVPNAFLNRTQAGQVGAKIIAQAKPGDVVAICPDQLGPAVSRVLGGRFTERAFPRDNAPAIVDWVNYLNVARSASAAKFVEAMKKLAGPHGTIFYVWAPMYIGFGSKCQEIADALHRWPHHKQKILVQIHSPPSPFEIIEGETLDRFSPK